LRIEKATAITWADPADITYGTPLSAVQLDATASVLGTYTYSPPSGTVLSVGQGQVLTLTFVPTDSTDYATVSATAAVNVDQAAPDVSVSPVNLPYGAELINSQLSGIATWIVGASPVTVPGSFSYTSAAGTVLGVGVGQRESVTFAPTDLTDFSTVTTTVIVNVSAPPAPLVTVESLQPEKIKAGKGKKAKKETVLVLQFSGALNAAAADNANAYELAPVITVKAKHKRPGTSRLGAPVPPASAVYNPATNQVTLTPRGTLNPTKPEELIVNGSVVTDALGRPIDGDDDGQPGSHYIATLTGARVTLGGLPLARAREQSTVSTAIDALLARGELNGLHRSPRARREARMRT
jgi:hypothetical protein